MGIMEGPLMSLQPLRVLVLPTPPLPSSSKMKGDLGMESKTPYEVLVSTLDIDCSIPLLPQLTTPWEEQATHAAP